MKRDPLRGPAEWRVYIVTDEGLSRGRSTLEVARAAIAGGADVIQLRDKTADSRKLYEEAMALRTLTHAAGVALVINDRADIAVACDAEGLHIGDRDLPAQEARRLIGPDRILGVSIPDWNIASRVVADEVDYVGVGPVYEARTTKPDAGEPLGLELLGQARRAVSCPVIAIGGISRVNAADVIRAGATGVAVISDIIGVPDIEAATRELREVVEEAFAAIR